MMPPHVAGAWQGADQILDESACPICLHESCEGGCAPTDAPEADETPAPAPRLRAMPAADVIRLPRPADVIAGHVTVQGLTVTVSESGTGKTFVALSQAAHVSDLSSWHGLAVESGSAVLMSFEGDALGTRLQALREVQGHSLEHVYIIRASDPLSPHIGRDGNETPSVGELDARACLEQLAADLAAAGKPPIRLLVIDTLRASMSGSEDNSGDVSAYLRAVRRLLACLPEAGANITHHAGWQDGEGQRKRERGSSALRGNVDTTLYLEAGKYDRDRGEAELTLRTLKTRDGEIPPPLRLIRRRVALDAIGRDGQPLTSCVIEPDRRTREDREAEQVASVEAEAHALDLRTLRAIADRPDLAGNKDTIRAIVGARKTVIVDSMDRLIRAGWLLPPVKQRAPYTVTEAGQQALAGGQP